jgi:hypothetical protein
MNASPRPDTAVTGAARRLSPLAALACVAVACAIPAAATELRPGDLVVVDVAAPDGGALVRIDPASRTRSVISAAGEFDLPAAVALEPGGSILVLDLGPPGGQPQVLRVDPASGASTATRS